MYKIIILEDDPMVASINSQYIQSNPQFAIAASFSNGEEALNYLAGHSVDLAIVDYYMPVMDGASFIRKCREQQLQLSIIMITAASSVAEVTEIMRLGVIDYLIKPFTYERFQLALEKYLRIQKALEVQDDHLMQDAIDQILLSHPSTAKKPPVLLDKGLQPQTLALIRQYLADHQDTFLCSEEIAKNVSLSRITVRRYMNYLLESGEITSRVDYSTGGRPSLKYQMIRLLKNGPASTV